MKLDPLYQDLLMKNLITPSQAQKLSRLPPEGQRLLFEKIKDGKANTYNKLRSLAKAIYYNRSEEQLSLIPEATPEEKETLSKYDRMIEGLLRLISMSHSKNDLKILKSVLESSISVNIKKIDLIIQHLNDIKRALLQAESVKEVVLAPQSICH